MSLKGKLYTSCCSFCCNKVAAGTCCLTREERDSAAQYLSMHMLEKTQNHDFLGWLWIAQSKFWTLQAKVPEGFPSGSVVENPAAKAGDRGSIPDPGDPTCPGATTPWPSQLRGLHWGREPQLLKPERPRACALQKRGHGNDKPAHCREE